jgi:diguanylate cyclase (GGDEF)-like protein
LATDSSVEDASAGDAALERLRVAREDMRAQADARSQRISVVVVGISVILVSALCAVARLIVFRPLRAMRAAMHELSGGALHRRLGWHRSDEIGALARQFDVMAADLERAHLQLLALALEDPLTGVANQRASHQELVAAVELARRSESLLTVGMLDIDHFKQINDTMGHMVGDEALRRLGSVLASRLRPSDLCGRLGGDEFVIAMAGTDADMAVEIVERIADDLRSVPLGPSGYRPTISVGLSVFPLHGGTSQELLTCADHALYAAKEAGRNTVRTYQDAVAPSPGIVIKTPQMWRGATVS